MYGKFTTKYIKSYLITMNEMQKCENYFSLILDPRAIENKKSLITSLKALQFKIGKNIYLYTMFYNL